MSRLGVGAVQAEPPGERTLRNSFFMPTIAIRQAGFADCVDRYE